MMPISTSTASPARTSDERERRSKASSNLIMQSSAGFGQGSASAAMSNCHANVEDSEDWNVSHVGSEKNIPQRTCLGSLCRPSEAPTGLLVRFLAFSALDPLINTLPELGIS